MRRGLGDAPPTSPATGELRARAEVVVGRAGERPGAAADTVLGHLSTDGSLRG